LCFCIKMRCLADVELHVAVAERGRGGGAAAAMGHAARRPRRPKSPC
jgi:hypothetical protein